MTGDSANLNEFVELTRNGGQRVLVIHGGSLDNCVAACAFAHAVSLKGNAVNVICGPVGELAMESDARPNIVVQCGDGENRCWPDHTPDIVNFDVSVAVEGASACQRVYLTIAEALKHSPENRLGMKETQWLGRWRPWLSIAHGHSTGATGSDRVKLLGGEITCSGEQLEGVFDLDDAVQILDHLFAWRNTPHEDTKDGCAPCKAAPFLPRTFHEEVHRLVEKALADLRHNVTSTRVEQIDGVGKKLTFIEEQAKLIDLCFYTAANPPDVQTECHVLCAELLQRLDEIKDTPKMTEADDLSSKRLADEIEGATRGSTYVGTRGGCQCPQSLPPPPYHKALEELTMEK